MFLNNTSIVNHKREFLLPVPQLRQHSPHGSHRDLEGYHNRDLLQLLFRRHLQEQHLLLEKQRNTTYKHLKKIKVMKQCKTFTNGYQIDRRSEESPEAFGRLVTIQEVFLSTKMQILPKEKKKNLKSNIFCYSERWVNRFWEFYKFLMHLPIIKTQPWSKHHVLTNIIISMCWEFSYCGQ